MRSRRAPRAQEQNGHSGGTSGISYGKSWTAVLRFDGMRYGRRRCKMRHGRARRWSRRRFLRASAAATALAVPTIVPASVFGAKAPSNRITLGCIGVGNKGTDILRKFLQFEDCQVVAVCDVNRGSGGYRDDSQFLGREPARAGRRKALCLTATIGQIPRLCRLLRLS